MWLMLAPTHPLQSNNHTQYLVGSLFSMANHFVATGYVSFRVGLGTDIGSIQSDVEGKRNAMLVFATLRTS
jgi:hypothetical protein